MTFSVREQKAIQTALSWMGLDADVRFRFEGDRMMVILKETAVRSDHVTRSIGGTDHVVAGDERIDKLQDLLHPLSLLCKSGSPLTSISEFNSEGRTVFSGNSSADRLTSITLEKKDIDFEAIEQRLQQGAQRFVDHLVNDYADVWPPERRPSLEGPRDEYGPGIYMPLINPVNQRDAAIQLCADLAGARFNDAPAVREQMLAHQQKERLVFRYSSDQKIPDASKRRYGMFVDIAALDKEALEVLEGYARARRNSHVIAHGHKHEVQCGEANEIRLANWLTQATGVTVKGSNTHGLGLTFTVDPPLSDAQVTSITQTLGLEAEMSDHQLLIATSDIHASISAGFRGMSASELAEHLDSVGVPPASQAKRLTNQPWRPNF